MYLKIFIIPMSRYHNCCFRNQKIHTVFQIFGLAVALKIVKPFCQHRGGPV